MIGPWQKTSVVTRKEIDCSVVADTAESVAHSCLLLNEVTTHKSLEAKMITLSRAMDESKGLFKLIFKSFVDVDLLEDIDYN
jgi:hypothetical protein